MHRLHVCWYSWRDYYAHSFSPALQCIDFLSSLASAFLLAVGKQVPIPEILYITQQKQSNHVCIDLVKFGSFDSCFVWKDFWPVAHLPGISPLLSIENRFETEEKMSPYITSKPLSHSVSVLSDIVALFHVQLIVLILSTMQCCWCLLLLMAVLLVASTIL